MPPSLRLVSRAGVDCQVISPCTFLLTTGNPVVVGYEGYEVQRRYHRVGTRDQKSRDAARLCVRGYPRTPAIMFQPDFPPKSFHPSQTGSPANESADCCFSLRGSSVVERWPHKPFVASSILAPATNFPSTVCFGDVAQRLGSPLSAERVRVRVPSSPPKLC